ncbi:ABC transporter permease [Dongia deserti]|uniref:ABC transporter permease n=1 Tax=Dongia deserti TaxID=2268030 RepID=UPI000E64DBBA|nr:ABC transporter permease [Dongia deserti]
MNERTSSDGASAPLPHYVSPAPFDPYSVERTTPEQEKIYLASQWKLMALKFKRHRVAVVSAIVLALMYLAVLGVEFLSPYHQDTRNVQHIYVPPQPVHLFHKGEFIGPFVYALDYKLDMSNLKRTFTENPEKPLKIRFFCRGDRYNWWGVVPGDLHLVCPPEGGPMFLLGSDRLGRDMLSRVLYGMRISLTIGIMGVAVSIVLGIALGGLAGYYGGWVDDIVQRVIEVIRSIPHLPLWLALAAILPVTWSPLWIYFGITIILGLIDWTGLARAVRSRLLSLREEDFCVAAQLMGASPRRIIFRHLMPSFMSHLIASATLAIPNMILGETALSFLGLGIRPPITSWGVLLNEAQNINVVVLYPWLMLPIVPVIIVVLAFNFMGDGLRDAADPYR